MEHIDDKLNPERKITARYMKATCDYYSKEYQRAQREYETCVKMIERLPYQQQKTNKF